MRPGRKFSFCPMQRRKHHQVRQAALETRRKQPQARRPYQPGERQRPQLLRRRRKACCRQSAKPCRNPAPRRRRPLQHHSPALRRRCRKLASPCRRFLQHRSLCLRPLQTRHRHRRSRRHQHSRRLYRKLERLHQQHPHPVSRFLQDLREFWQRSPRRSQVQHRSRCPPVPPRNQPADQLHPYQLHRQLPVRLGSSLLPGACNRLRLQLGRLRHSLRQRAETCRLVLRPAWQRHRKLQPIPAKCCLQICRHRRWALQVQCQVRHRHRHRERLLLEHLRLCNQAERCNRVVRYRHLRLHLKQPDQRLCKGSQARCLGLRPTLRRPVPPCRRPQRSPLPEIRRLEGREHLLLRLSHRQVRRLLRKVPVLRHRYLQQAKHWQLLLPVKHQLLRALLRKER